MALRTAASSFNTPLAKEDAKTVAGSLDPWREAFAGFGADHLVEVSDDLACFDERWKLFFNDSHDKRVGFREMVSLNGHKPCDRPGRGCAGKTALIGFLRPLAPPRPLADHAEATSKALVVQLPPQSSSVPGTAFPLAVEPLTTEAWQVGFERALPYPENVVVLASKNTAHKL